MVIADPHNKTTIARARLDATEAALEAELLPWEKAREWRETVPGYDLLREQIPDKLIYRLLVRHKARYFWNRLNPPARRWFSPEKHRSFTGRMLAQFALANGWNESQTAFLLEAWRYRHELPLHEVELRQMLVDALKATAGLRKAFDDTKERIMKDKTSYRILEFLIENGPATPAEAAGELEVPRERIKKALQRLAKTGEVQKLGRGRYSAGTETGTSEVIELEKNKKTYSITKDVPALSPAPENPSIGPQEPSAEELYLRQIEYTENPDGTFVLNIPDEPEDGLTAEQEQRLQEETARWEEELEAYQRAHPQAMRPREDRPRGPLRTYIGT